MADDYPGTDFPKNINEWTKAQREEVGSALGVYGNPKITAGLDVLATDPPAGEVTKKDLQEEGPGATTNPPAPASPESAYEQLADTQANQYLALTKSLGKELSTQSTDDMDSTISSGAEAMLGQSSTSPMSQWLNQQTKAAQAQYAPTQAAAAQVNQAENWGAGLEAGALKEFGQAETAEMNAAPYQQLLQSLAQEVPYHLATNYSPFPALEGKNVPTWLQDVEKGVGVNTQNQGPGGSGISGGAPTLPSYMVAGSTATVPPTTTDTPSQTIP